MVLRNAVVRFEVLLIRRVGRLDAHPGCQSVTINDVRVSQAVVVGDQVGDRAYACADSIRLAFRVSLNNGNVPSRLYRQAMYRDIGPSFVSDVNGTVCVGDHNQNFRVEVIAVRRLVPRAFAALTNDGAACVDARRLRCFVTLEVVLQRRVRSLARDRRHPAVNASPVRDEVVLRAFRPSVARGIFPKCPRAIHGLGCLACDFTRVRLLFVANGA